MTVTYGLNSPIGNGSVKGLHYQARVAVFRGNSAGATTDNPYSYGQDTLPFVYHASEWSNSSFYAEFGISVPNGNTVYVGMYDLTNSTKVAGTEVSATFTASGGTVLRTPAVTLVDGHIYSVYMRAASAGGQLFSADILALF